MTFSTLTFLLVFLPLLLTLYFICPAKYTAIRNGILLVFSLIFYAWGEPMFILLIVLCAGLTYLLSYSVQNGRKSALIISLIVNLLPLAAFKYANFIIFNFCNVFGLPMISLNLSLPIGISFYTFQIISYIVDLYWGKVKIQRNWAYLLLYVFFFPQLVAGPIVRYKDIEEEIYSRRTTRRDFYEGSRRIIIGLSKKMLIANTAGEAVSIIRAQDQALVGPALLWVCVISYGVQIYFDFSGYSDMAIGLGRIFGFHFLENFRKPYISRSITEFWRRWHISLSSFFRDYVYIPLGGNKVRVSRHIYNMFVVWFLSGLWHGASWNYVLWGLYYFVLLVMEKYVYGSYLDKLPKLPARAITFFLYMFGWAIFLFESNSLSELGGFLSRLFGAFAPAASLSLRGLEIQGNLLVVLLGLILSMTDTPKFFRIFAIRKPRISSLLSQAGLLLLLCASVVSVIGSSFNPFIYFRF